MRVVPAVARVHYSLINNKHTHTHRYMGWGSLGQLMGVQGSRVCVILVLHEYILNAPAISLVLPTFDNTGSLGFPPRQVVYPPG